MLKVQLVIDKIKAFPACATYSVQHSRIKEPQLAELTTLPIIFVAYHTVNSKNPSTPLAADLFNQHGEDLTQVFEIQIACETVNFDTIWKNVYKSLIGWHPDVLEMQHTGMTYIQGGVMGLENGRLWWLDRWGINFPLTNVDM